VTNTQLFQLYADAITNCTSYWLKKDKDDEGETIYCLIDGCGDQDGDPFYDLIDVADYIFNNEDVYDYVQRRVK